MAQLPGTGLVIELSSVFLLLKFSSEEMSSLLAATTPVDGPANIVETNPAGEIFCHK